MFTVISPASWIRTGADSKLSLWRPAMATGGRLPSRVTSRQLDGPQTEQ